MESPEVVHHFIVPGEEEVLARLESYEDPQVTTHLYDLGSFILRERIEQTTGLDTKAGLLAGFVGAIIALLLSTYSHWQVLAARVPYGWLFVFIGTLSLWLAAFSTVAGIWPRYFQWLDEKDVWFAKNYLTDPEQLRRYHLIGMYRAAVSREQVNTQKFNLLLLSHVLLVVGIAMLAIIFLHGMWYVGTS